jgi:hypothetical protein
MRFQQNLAAKQAEHGTTGSQLCGCGGEGWKQADGCAVPGDRAHAVPAVEATTAVRWCGLVQRARRGGAGATVVGRKAGRRRGREGGVEEPWRSHGDA